MLFYSYFLFIISLFRWTHVIGQNLITIENATSVPNQGSFGVSLQYQDAQPNNDTDIVLIQLIQGSVGSVAEGNITITGGQSGDVVITVTYVSSLPEGAPGVYLLGSIYPSSFSTDPTQTAYYVSTEYPVSIVASGSSLTNCYSGSNVTTGATQNSISIAPGVILSVPSCGSFILPVAFSVAPAQSETYAMVFVADVASNTMYGNGQCRVKQGSQGTLSIFVTIYVDIPLSAGIFLNLYLVDQASYDANPSTVNNYGSQTGVQPSVTKCPGSQSSNAQSPSLTWFKQNGWYIIMAFVIVMIIIGVIYYLHKQARSRGQSIVFMVRKSTVAMFSTRKRTVGLSMDPMTQEQKEREAKMLQEPLGRLSDLQTPPPKPPSSPSSPDHSPLPPSGRGQMDDSAPKSAAYAPIPPSYSSIPRPPPPASPVPTTEWQKVLDSERGVEYYWNPTTGVTQWEKPDGF